MQFLSILAQPTMGCLACSPEWPPLPGSVFNHGLRIEALSHTSPSGPGKTPEEIRTAGAIAFFTLWKKI
jgi:hypothetical protein